MKVEKSSPWTRESMGEKNITKVTAIKQHESAANPIKRSAFDCGLEHS